MPPADARLEVGDGFQPRREELGIPLRPHRRPAQELRVPVDGIDDRGEGRWRSDPPELTGHGPEVRRGSRHLRREVAPRRGHGGLRPLAIYAGQPDRDLRAGDVGRRGGAGVDPALHQRREPLERCDLPVEQLHALLSREDDDERRRDVRQDLQAHRRLLVTGNIVVRQGRRHAGVALAGELDELAQLERGLGATTGCQGIVDLERHSWIGHHARLLTPAFGHPDIAFGGGNARIGVQRPLQRLLQRQRARGLGRCGGCDRESQCRA